MHDLFEEQTNPDGLILKTMNRAQTLLKCERCSVFLRDGTSEVIHISCFYSYIMEKRS